MSRYKAKVIFPDGSSYLDDNEFETYEHAEAYFGELENHYMTGVETLHLSNPGDYPLEYEELKFEVIEIDD